MLRELPRVRGDANAGGGSSDGTAAGVGVSGSGLSVARIAVIDRYARQQYSIFYRKDELPLLGKGQVVPIVRTHALPTSPSEDRDCHAGHVGLAVVQ